MKIKLTFTLIFFLIFFPYIFVFSTVPNDLTLFYQKNTVYEIDQSCEETKFQSELNSVTQTIVPTKDNIAKIAVNLRKGRNANFTIFIKLKDCTGKVLGVSSKLNSSQMIRHRYTFEWYEFDFKPPIGVKPNEKYEINLVCEGDCGRLSTVEDQIAFTYTNNDDCDPTGYLNVCNGIQHQDLSYKTFYIKDYKEDNNLIIILIIIPIVLVFLFLWRLSTYQQK